MKKLISGILAALFLSVMPATADWLFNPFTNRLDYYMGPSSSPTFLTSITINDADGDSQITLGFDADDLAELDLGSQAYHNLIQSSQAEGLAGADLRIGVDETLRSVRIMDRGDIATDLGRAAQAEPTLYLHSAGNPSGQWARYAWSGLYSSSGSYTIVASTGVNFQLNTDKAAGDAFVFYYGGGDELTGASGMQSWMKFAANVRQTNTASFDAIEIDVTSASYGDGSDGSGNNFIRCSDDTTDKFKVDVEGRIVTTISALNCSNPPTDLELDTEFGTPAAVGSGWQVYIDDNGAGANFYLVVSDGTNWWIFTGTKAL